jgi:hypothetical protein
MIFPSSTLSAAKSIIYCGGDSHRQILVLIDQKPAAEQGSSR